MYVRHKLTPNPEWISISIQIIKRLRIIIAYPYCSCIVWCISTEPSVFFITRCSCLSCTRHIVQCISPCSSTYKYALQNTCHHSGCILFVNMFFLPVFLVVYYGFSFRISNLAYTCRLSEHTIIFNSCKC